MPTPPKLAVLLDHWIKPHGPALSIKEKLDVLDRAVEWMRLELQHGRNQLDMDAFLGGVIEPRGAQLLYAPPPPGLPRDTGTPPIQLQPKLLLYLLLYHREGAPPLEVIDGLIAKILPELRAADFVRTKTGVTRCYTNTRFAANVLRAYGFLRFTQRERYKAWVLTLPGIIVAGHFLKTDGWKIGDHRRESGRELHYGIFKSFDAIRDYDCFVAALNHLLRDDTGLFKTFDHALREAHKLIGEFGEKAGDTDASQKVRRAECHTLMEQLEAKLGEDFYEEFSAAMNVEALIKAVDARP